MKMFGNYLVIFTCVCAVVSIKISNISEYCECILDNEFSCRGLHFSSEEVEFDISSKAACTGISFTLSDLYTIPRNAFALAPSADYFYVTECNLKDIFKWNFEGANQTRTLNLNNNYIEKIPTEVFEYMTNLEALSMKYNKIETLEVNCFYRLEMLEALYLKSNNIRNIREDTFQPLKKLRYIDLSENHIEYLADETFVHNPMLFYIDLGKNKLKIVDPETPPALRKLADADRTTNPAFLRLPNVERIILSQNYLPYIGNTTFSELKNVRQLYIESMHIERVEDGALDWLQNLETLSLAGNYLEDFEVNLLRHLPKLVDLDLSDNYLGLGFLDYELLANVSHVSSLRLSHNAWSCSLLQEITDFFSSTSISTDLEDSFCINDTSPQDPYTSEESVSLPSTLKDGRSGGSVSLSPAPETTVSLPPTPKDDNTTSSNVPTITLATILVIIVAILGAFCVARACRECQCMSPKSVLP